MGASLDDDIAELLFGGETPECVDGDLKGRRGVRLLTDRAGRNLHVLLPNGGDHIASGHATRRNLFGVEPDPHRVLTLTTKQHVGDARQACQFVTDVGGLANIAAQAPGSIEVSDVPVAKDFVKSNDDTRLLRGRYYDLTKEARKASEEFRQAKKAGDSDAMDKILSSPDKEEMIILSKFILSTNKAAAAIRDEMVDINADTSLSLPEKRAKLKELERDEAELYRDAIETFR